MKQFSSFESMETKNLKDNFFEKIFMGFQPFSIAEEDNFLIFPKLWNVAKIHFGRCYWKKVFFFSQITFCLKKEKKLKLVILSVLLWVLYFRHLGMQE